MKLKLSHAMGIEGQPDKKIGRGNSSKRGGVLGRKILSFFGDDRVGRKQTPKMMKGGKPKWDFWHGAALGKEVGSKSQR